MSENANEPAYPYGEHGTVLGGLTKRELIAAMAMQGLLARHGDDDYPEYHKLAEWAVGRADALLSALATANRGEEPA